MKTTKRTLARIDENTRLFDRARFKCPVCHLELGVKIDRRGKPYISCLPCGAMLFVRRDAGVERFLRERVVRPLRGAPTASHRPELATTNALAERAHG